MMIADQKLQFVLTACLIVLAGTALLVPNARFEGALQIGMSAVAIVVSFGAAYIAKRSHSAKLAESVESNGTADHAPPPLQQSEIFSHLETKSLHRHASKSSLANALYAHEVETVPVYKQGSHFVCDAEIEDNYSISIGIVNVEVEGGEAKIIIKRPEQIYAPTAEVRKNFLRTH